MNNRTEEQLQRRPQEQIDRTEHSHTDETQRFKQCFEKNAYESFFIEASIPHITLSYFQTGCVWCHTVLFDVCALQSSTVLILQTGSVVTWDDPTRGRALPTDTTLAMQEACLKYSFSSRFRNSALTLSQPVLIKLNLDLNLVLSCLTHCPSLKQNLWIMAWQPCHHLLLLSEPAVMPLHVTPPASFWQPGSHTFSCPMSVPLCQCHPITDTRQGATLTGHGPAAHTPSGPDCLLGSRPHLDVRPIHRLARQPLHQVSPQLHQEAQSALQATQVLEQPPVPRVQIVAQPVLGLQQGSQLPLLLPGLQHFGAELRHPPVVHAEVAGQAGEELSAGRPGRKAAVVPHELRAAQLRRGRRLLLGLVGRQRRHGAAQQLLHAYVGGGTAARRAPTRAGRQRDTEQPPRHRPALAQEEPWAQARNETAHPATSRGFQLGQAAAPPSERQRARWLAGTADPPIRREKGKCRRVWRGVTSAAPPSWVWRARKRAVGLFLHRRCWLSFLAQSFYRPQYTFLQAFAVQPSDSWIFLTCHYHSLLTVSQPEAQAEWVLGKSPWWALGPDRETLVSITDYADLRLVASKTGCLYSLQGVILPGLLDGCLLPAGLTGQCG